MNGMLAIRYETPQSVGEAVRLMAADPDARVLAGPGGERTVPVEEFCIAPGRTVLQRGELLIALRLPRPAARTSDAYLRLIPRSEMDIAVVGAAVSVTLDANGVCRSARVAIGAVAP